MDMSVTAGAAIPLVEGKLYALGCTVRHQGAIHWVPADAEGEAPLNAFLLLEGDEAVILDTSMPIAEHAILEQLKEFQLGSVKLLLSRAVEFDSVGNADIIIETHNVTEAWSGYETFEWVYHRSMDGMPAHIPFVSKMIENDKVVELLKGRPFHMINSRLKLLAATWVYDEVTRTLFTSDAFHHVLAPEPGVRVVTDATDRTTLVDVIANFRTKFYWMEGADTRPLRDSVNRIFASFDIERVAPTNGCVIEGRALVHKHRRLVIAALETLDGGRQ